MNLHLHLHADRGVDARLSELEREMEPVLTSVWHASTPRPEFAVRLRADVTAPPAPPPHALPLVRQPSQWRRRAWGAVAAAVAGSVLVGSAALLYRPQPANAEAVLDQLQTEAARSAPLGGVGGCAAATGTATTGATTGGMLVIGTDGGKAGSISFSSASELSDKLAAALGVSGDQVRQAMLETMQSLMPATAPPPDPMAAIAQQLGVPETRVCQAFFGSASAQSVVIARSSSNANAAFASQNPVGPDGHPALNLSTASTDQLAGIAATLGVSPERLQAAIKAALVQAAPPNVPAPPSQQQIVSAFARNLGLDEGRVSAALNQVEGNSGFYFVVTLPGGSR